VNKVSVDIYDLEVFAKLKAGLMSKEEAQKLVVIWAGEGRSKIEKQGRDYVDGNIRIIGYPSAGWLPR
jgi:hypothetical protein